MAKWNRVATDSTAGNISMNVEIGIKSVTRTSNTNVKVIYGVRFAMSSATYTYNSVAAFCPKNSGNRYYAFNHSSGHTSSGTWYYANTTGDTTTKECTPFTQNITVTVTQTSATFSVGYGWDGYTPSQKGSSSLKVTFPTGATPPTGCWCSATPVDETSFTLSGGYGSNGNSTVTATGFQYRKDGTNTWSNCTANPTGLEVNTKYYFRYYATNAQGTSYSGDTSTSATTYDYPHIERVVNSDLIIGSIQQVDIYNPLKRSWTLYMNQNDMAGTLLATISGSTGGSATYEFTPDATTLYNSIPNNQEGDCVYYIVCDDPSHTTNITTGKYVIRGNELPNFSNEDWSYSADLTSLTGNNQTVINNYSTITYSINNPATSSYGATIVKYVYKWGNISKDSTIGNTVKGGNGSVIEVTAVDSRGLLKTTNKTLVSGTTYIPYTLPTLDYSSSYTHRRDGISNETELTLRGNLSIIKFGNLGINNSVYSAKYKVYSYSTETWSNEFNIPSNNFTISENGRFTLSEFLIHENGSSGGFTVGNRYAIQVILKDGQGLLGTLTTNAILINDGKIARDVYQDGNGNYHQGINGLANEDYTNIIYGDEKITGSLYIGDALYIDDVKMIWFTES